MVIFESSAFVYKEAASSTIDYNNGTIIKATLTATEVSTGDYNLSYFMSADGGIHWESVTNGVEHTFTNTGTDLRYKITGTGAVRLTKIVINITHS